MSAASEIIQDLLSNDHCSCPKGQPCPRCVLAINDAKRFLNQPKPLAADPVREALAAKVEQWRKEASLIPVGGWMNEGNSHRVEILESCADELEAALRLAERKE